MRGTTKILALLTAAAFLAAITAGASGATSPTTGKASRMLTAGHLDAIAEALEARGFVTRTPNTAAIPAAPDAPAFLFAATPPAAGGYVHVQSAWIDYTMAGDPGSNSPTAEIDTTEGPVRVTAIDVDVTEAFDDGAQLDLYYYPHDEHASYLIGGVGGTDLTTLGPAAIPGFEPFDIPAGATFRPAQPAGLPTVGRALVTVYYIALPE